jgi:hypothetical protein
MFFRDFIISYTLIINLVNFVMVILALVINLEYLKISVACTILTNFISLLYNYFSIEINTHELELSFV